YRGMQLYRVDEVPNSLSGLGEVSVAAPYYGLFVCNYMPQSVSYDITIDNSCNSFVRENNSDLSWDQIDSHESNRLVIYGHSDKSEEIISTLGTKFSLGADATLCPGGTILLQTESVNYE